MIARKMCLLAIGLSLAIVGSAVAQNASGGGSGPTKQNGQLYWEFEGLKLTAMQQLLFSMVVWKQSLALQDLGGAIHVDYSRLPKATDNARSEVVYACNLYFRSFMSSEQQKTFDKRTLNVKNRPLPAKWEAMRQKGTLFHALLKNDPVQQAKARTVLETFQDRNGAIWGTGFVNGGYAANLELALKEFEAILSPEQRQEFSTLWNNYSKEIANAKLSASK